MTTEKQIASSIQSRLSGVRFVSLVCSAALSCILLAGCSKNDPDTPPATGDGVIRINAQIAASSPANRGVSLGSQAQTGLVFLRKDAAGTTAPTSFAGAASFTANRETSGALSNFSAKQLYNANNTTAYFIGYHPAGTISSGATTWTIANGGKTDLLLTNAAWSAGNFASPKTTGMTFDHQLAQLQVVCKADPDDDLSSVQSAWGQITKIEIMETATTAKFDHSTLQMSFSGSAALTLSAADCQTTFSNVTLATGTTTPCAGGMFAPDLTSTKPLKLKVYTQTETAGKTVDVQFKSGTTNKGFAKGMTHTVTLTFGIKDGQISAAVTSWAINDDTEDIWGTAKPSDGCLIWSSPSLIKSGNFDGASYTITNASPLSYNRYNIASSSFTSGYKADITAARAEAVSYRLEVAQSNETASNWSDAWAACKTKLPAGAWRLPRMTELMLMFLNQTELNTTAGFTAIQAADYWSGTEVTADNAWSLNLSTGASTSNAKTTNTINVRCVKELAHSTRPTVEDYYYSDGTFSRDLTSGKSVEGVIYWVDPLNPWRFRIVSMDEPPANWEGGTNSAGCLQWSTEEVVTGVTSTTDGKGNTLTLMKRSNAASAYPAAKWCYTKNARLSVPAPSTATTTDAAYGWYLPASDELQHLFCAYRGASPTTWATNTTGAPVATVGYPAAWNARFSGATNFASPYYWSSTESYNNTSWYVYFDTGIMYGNLKTYTRYIPRCVREILIP